MLAVLEQAQASVRKPSRMSRSVRVRSSTCSVDGNAGGPRPWSRRATPRFPRRVRRTELLAAEKESIGLFVSAHPLKELSAAMTAATDCSLGPSVIGVTAIG